MSYSLSVSYLTLSHRGCKPYPRIIDLIDVDNRVLTFLKLKSRMEFSHNRPPRRWLTEPPVRGLEIVTPVVLSFIQLCLVYMIRKARIKLRVPDTFPPDVDKVEVSPSVFAALPDLRRHHVVIAVLKTDHEFGFDCA